jgi:hypothetical protein
MDTALVIGAGGGIGIHISRQLADHRYQVSGLARSERSAAAWTAPASVRSGWTCEPLPRSSSPPRSTAARPCSSQRASVSTPRWRLWKPPTATPPSGSSGPWRPSAGAASSSSPPTARRGSSRAASSSHGEKYSSRCIPSGDASPANSASCQEFFPLRPRQQPQQVSPPVPPHPRVREAPRDLHEHLGERLRPRGMSVPAAIRTSSTTPEHAPTLADGGPQSTQPRRLNNSSLL